MFSCEISFSRSLLCLQSVNGFMPDTYSTDISFLQQLTDVCQCLVVQIPLGNMSKNKPSTSMAHVACESKLGSVVRSAMHPCTGSRVTIGRAVVYFVWDANSFSTGMKCWHGIGQTAKKIRADEACN